MLKGLFKKSSPEQKFWLWFEKNSDLFYNMTEENQEELFDLFHDQLQKVNEELVFEFSAKPDENGIREMVISADGIKELIPVVLKLVNLAPSIHNWKFTAFRQREEDVEINFKGYVISSDTVFFAYELSPDEKQIGIYLFVENYEEEMMGALFLLLDSLLGEFEVMTKLGFIEFEDITNSNTEELLPLSKLHDLVNQID